MEIPIIRAKKAMKAFNSIGYKAAERKSGSHVRLAHNNKEKHKSITIPDHGKTIKPFLLLKIIKDAGLILEEFKKLLKEI